MYFDAESEFEVKIAPYTLSFEGNLEKGYFLVYDGKK